MCSILFGLCSIVQSAEARRCSTATACVITTAVPTASDRLQKNRAAIAGPCLSRWLRQHCCCPFQLPARPVAKRAEPRPMGPVACVQHTSLMLQGDRAHGSSLTSFHYTQGFRLHHSQFHTNPTNSTPNSTPNSVRHTANCRCAYSPDQLYLPSKVYVCYQRYNVTTLCSLLAQPSSEGHMERGLEACDS